jgi:serine phosphatase RsbU (regulator of sigma subunit)
LNGSKKIDQIKIYIKTIKMAKSKKRGGEKAHRKRLQQRNNTLKAEQSAMQKLFNESMKAQIEALKQKDAEQVSGLTANQ